MEPLLDDSSTSRDQGSMDNLERARLYFEKKAGRPVSTAEAREWLDRLVEYLRTAQRWAREAAEREAAGISSVDAQQAGHEATGISSVEAQQAGHETSGRSCLDDQLAAHEAAGMSSMDVHQAGLGASGISTQDVQQAAQGLCPDVQRPTLVSDQDIPQADQQAVHEESGISSRDIPGLPSPKASRRIAARRMPRASGRNIPQDAQRISMDVHKSVQTDRAARSGQE